MKKKVAEKVEKKSLKGQDNKKNGDVLKNRFLRWLDGEFDAAADIMETDETPYSNREEIKKSMAEIRQDLKKDDRTGRLEAAEKKHYYRIYNVVAVISAILLIGTLLFVISFLPRFGRENPESTEVVRRYVEKGMEETGAVNIVAGMILDYRAFDTLGESHVLFTALICVMILLRLDTKNQRRQFEDYYRTTSMHFHDISNEAIMRNVGMVLIPCIFLFGVYVLLNGQNGPGGGFSGGAVMGGGLIIFSSAFGFDTADRFFTAKLSAWITFAALAFYSFAKGYVFFTGANGLDNHIPKGTPGAILSGGMILPLDIAVGLVVACTMYGFYSLFRRGNIGGA
ncbi:MAG: hypothetical protein IJ123_07230 [Blautia sp.]|nr:hypothetical protein [Blautia sp.]